MGGVGCVRIVNVLVNVLGNILVNILIVSVYVVAILKISLSLPTIVSVGDIDRLLTCIHINVAPVNKLYLIAMTSPVHHDIVQFDIPVQDVKVRQVP